MAKLLFAFVLVSAHTRICASLSGSYPATYPFDNEITEFESLQFPAAEPSRTYDPATETGGFYIKHGLLLDLLNPYIPEDVATGMTFTMNSGAMSYGWVSMYSIPPVLAAETWNCTGNVKFAASDFLGVINAEAICNAGECCSFLYGQETFSAEAMALHETYNTRSAVGMCDAVPESAYCILVNGYVQHACYGRIQTATERTFTTACFDSIGLWYATCKVFAATGIGADLNTWEAPLYLDACTPLQTFAIEGLVNIMDRVCFPYTYYFPVKGQDIDDDSEASSDESSRSESILGLLFSFITVAFSAEA